MAAKKLTRVGSLRPYGHSLSEGNKFNDVDFKQKWLQAKLKSKEAQFTEPLETHVLCASWNVNGRKPPDNLHEWLSTQKVEPDIIIVGFQELDLTTEALILREVPERSIPWENAVIKSLNGNGDNYELRQSKQMCGVLILFIVHKKHRDDVSDVVANTTSTGVMRVLGNKGGVGVRFRFYDSTIACVNAHFNAHQKNVSRRNQDYHDIFNGTTFTVDGELWTLADHDHLFFFGDLNYRIDLPDQTVRAKIDEKDYKYLFQYDQLTENMAKGNVFTGWSEGHIDFAPTYKYDTFSTIYDTSPKNRVPSWTDRILFRGDDIKILTYQRHELLSSDHRPITGLFKVNAKQIIQEKRARVLADSIKDWDKMENAAMPDAKLSGNNVNFGDVRYGSPINRTLELENIGRVPAQFQFIPKPGEKRATKPWLWINPAMEIVNPGEKIQLNFTVNIQKETAPEFNMNDEELSDILVLHLKNGKDMFITITGNYLKSCMGCSFGYLVQFQKPIRTGSPMGTDNKKRLLKIPKELWRVIEWLHKNALDEEEIFCQQGDAEACTTIRECLDTGMKFPEDLDAHSMAETMLALLETQEEALFPPNLYKIVIEAVTYASAKQVVSYLPDCNFNIFYYIMSFLRELLQHKDKNALTSDILAATFSQVMIRSQKSTTHTTLQCKKFIHHFLNEKEPLKLT